MAKKPISFLQGQFYTVTQKKYSAPNSDGLINCLLQPGQFHHDTKRSSIYRDIAITHVNPDTDGNELYGYIKRYVYICAVKILNIMKTAVTYFRVSSNKQQDDRQLEDVESFCKKEGYEIVQVFREKISGTIKKRAKVLEMLQYIDDNNIKYLIISEVSRLGRQNEIITILDDLTAKGVCTIFLKENLFTLNPDGSTNQTTSLLINILAGMAKNEVETLAYRIKSGKNNGVINKGYFGGGKYVCYGYQVIDKKLVINPQESLIVKQVFDLYLKGWGGVKISNYLNAKVIPTKTNAKWQRTTIQRMIRNTIYCGKRIWDSETIDTPELRIIDDIIYQNALERLKEAKNRNMEYNKLQKYFYLFDKSIIKCQCGKHYAGIGKYDIYKCISGKHSKGCGNPVIRLSWLEQTIQQYLAKNWIKLIYDNTDLLNQSKELETELLIVKQDKQKQLTKLDRYAEMYSEDRITKIQYNLKVETTDKLLEKIQDNIQSIQKRIQTNRTSQTILVRADYKLIDGKYNLNFTKIDKETIHKVIKSINVSMLDGNQFIDVILINGNTFTL